MRPQQGEPMENTDIRNVKPAGIIAPSEEWYAMRATYRREMTARRLLSDAGIENFVPMREILRVTGVRKRRLLVPAVHGLIFVRSDRETIYDFKQRLPYLQYMIRRNRGGEKGSPITVPEKQMQDFMKVCLSCRDDVQYLPAGGRNIPRGAGVRIRGGALDGVEGVLARTAGSRDRKVIVTIEGVMSVTASVKQGMIELIDID